jgi:KUP system potassium uptake protein
VAQREHEQAVPIDTLLATIEPSSLNRPQGTAIYLTTFADSASNSLMQNLRHNGVLHEHVVLLTVHLLDEPFVSPEDRIRVRELGSGIHRAVLCYGFMEKPDAGHDIAGLASHGIPVDPVHTSFFIGHNNIVSGEHPLLPSWQRRLFLMLSRFAASPTDFLGLPANRTVELGSRIEV